MFAGTLVAVGWLRLCFHCWGHKFDPWLRSYDRTCFSAKKPKHKVNKNLKKFHIEKIFFKKAGNRAVGEGKGTPDWEGGVQEFWMKDVVQVVPGYVCRGRFSVILCKRK